MTKKQPNRLTQENLIKLTDWLKSHKESLEQLPHTYRQIAEMAAKELSFPVADNSIERLARYLNINIKGIPGVSGGRQAKINTKRLEKVREYLAILYQKCGEQVPEELGVNW